jgi:hypothetical protein
MDEVWQYKVPENSDDWDSCDFEEFIRMDKGHSSSCDWMVHLHPGIKTED